jgi:predicted aspartyl protease
MHPYSHVSRSIVAAVVFLLSGTAHADFDVLVPMTDSGAGNYSVSASFGADPAADFLIDTGAALTTISSRLFRELQRTRKLEPVRRVAARLADGRLRAMNVYHIDDFHLGDHCSLGAIEVAVMANDGRNILGMSALAKTAPFGLHLTPAALALTRCQDTVELAANYPSGVETTVAADL